jgi:NADH dehydrogenase
VLKEFPLQPLRRHDAHHNVVSMSAEEEGRTLAGLGIEHPHAMEAVVPGYLERFQPHGQFVHYR